jgi:hypothetical protein
MTICLAVLTLLITPVLSGDVVSSRAQVKPPAALATTTAGQVWIHTVGAGTPAMALGDEGGQAVVLSSGSMELLSAFDGTPPQPVWAVPGVDISVFARAAKSTDVYLASLLEVVGPTSSQGTLMLYTSASPTPVWSHVFATQAISAPLFDVSRDGQVVVSVFDDDASLTHEFRVHDPVTGAVDLLHTFPSQTYTNRFDLSPDGSTMVHSRHDGQGMAYLIDVASGAIVLATPGSIPPDQALSNGGDAIITRDRPA